MKRFEITPLARADLFEIEEYIARDSPAAARKVALKLREAMRLLARMPHIGHQRLDVPDQRHRFWNVYSYLIVYHPETNPLQILRVVHGHRDLPRVIQEHE